MKAAPPPLYTKYKIRNTKFLLFLREFVQNDEIKRHKKTTKKKKKREEIRVVCRNRNLITFSHAHGLWMIVAFLLPPHIFQ